jgi:hypothetical protein
MRYYLFNNFFTKYYVLFFLKFFKITGQKKGEEQMKKVTVLIFMLILLGLADNSAAVSPMPEGVKPGAAATVCTIHIACITDSEREMPEEQTSTFAFEVSEAKKDVLEWVTKYINNKLSEKNVSEFKIECKFPQK